ncbi:MAG TPA: hypothetical protein VER03_20365 [Bryobacteraceae bacterium]|nr:hypothetical protein [Bryobacteraceae bacterium]
MASWKFTDDYGAKYPALQSSVLSLLVFSDHTLTGTAFVGTLDVGASGAALATLGQLLSVSSIAVSGQVADSGSTFSVALASTDAGTFRDGIAASIPLIGKQVTAASMSVNTVAATTDSSDAGPQKDDLDLSVTLTIGSSSLVLTSVVPMHGGLFTIDGTFDNVGVGLDDLKFLMGSLQAGDQWFPSTQLGPYYSGGAKLSLLGLDLTINVNLSPFTVTVVSVTVGIGLTGINLMSQKLYLNPLGVWVTVEDPGGSASVGWALEGAIVLCNYARPGDFKNPDFAFDFDMDLTNYSISGQLENADALSINTMLQDLLGQGTSVGLPTALTIDKFDFAAAVDKNSGSVSDFSTDLAMSGGFGLFETLDVEEISISVAYSA